MKPHRGVCISIVAVLALCPALFARTWVVNQQHAQACDASDATEAAPYLTINRAAEQAMPGDTVLVHAGVYRERVAPERSGTPNRPILYTAAPGEKVVIKGSDVWKPRFVAVKGQRDVYIATLDSALFRCRSTLHKAPDYNPYAIALVNSKSPRCLGQVFVDGEEYREVNSAAQVTTLPRTWIMENKGRALRIHFAPGKPLEQRVIELTVRGRIFAPYKRGVSYITVRGFVMEHCANQYPEDFYSRGGPPQAGALGCRGGSHWVIENCIIRHAKTVGIDCGREGPEDADGLNQRQVWNKAGFHIIRDNIIAYNGAAGIIGENARGCVIYNNVVDGNNTEGIRGMEGSGMKFHGFNDALIEGNLFRGNNTAGVWLDNEHSNTRITRNVFINNVGAGIFIELGRGPTLIDNNVVAFTVAGLGNAGDGLYSHDASGVTVAHNLFYFNANFGVWAHVGTDRGRDAPPRCSGWRVVNNIIVGNHRGAISMPPQSPRSNDNLSDYNLVAGPYSLTLSETWGEEMSRPFFLVNTNKDRVPIDSIAARFKVAMDSAKLPDSLRPNLALWKTLPLLNLDQWRLLSGNDRHSRWAMVIRPEFGPISPSLYLIIDDSPLKLGCLPVNGVDLDLFGNPLPTAKPLPGPFQKLACEPALNDRTKYATPMRGDFEKLQAAPERANDFVLWPLLRIEREDYLKSWRASMQNDIKRSTPPKYTANAVGSAANPALIRRGADVITVDGDDAEWAGVKPLPVPFDGKEAGMVSLLWRPEGVYGLVRAPWRRIRNNPEAPWEGDGIELYFQKDGQKPSQADSSSAQYIIYPVQNSDTCGVWAHQARGKELEKDVVALSKRLEQGHALEFFLPAGLFAPATMIEGTAIGFNYTVNARGEPAEEFYCHKNFDDAFRRPKWWGTVKLGK